MEITSKQRFKLKKFVKELKRHRGRHTELVSVYVPQGYELVKVIQHLAQEQGTAVNIKSTATRKNVQDALERMIQHLKLYKKTPEHGLAAFSGNVTEREGQSDVQVWSIEPPVPIKTRIYRCDKLFVTEILEEVLDSKNVYGLVAMDRRDAVIALLKGKAIVPLVKAHSQVPGKTRAGGQSSVRFARLREGAKNDHYKKIAEYMKEQFLSMKELKGIILGGPGVTINDFINKDYITADVRNKIIGTRDLCYTDNFGLQELVDASQDLLANEEIAQEKAAMMEFFKFLNTKPGMVSYGDVEVRKHLATGAVAKLLLSDTMDDDVIEQLDEEAKTLGSEVIIISTETREGVQLKEIGKIAAILRYEV